MAINKSTLPLQHKKPIINKVPKDLSGANFKIEKIEKETPIDPIEFSLKKEFYGRKEALLNLDEEFKHFILKTFSIEEFFNLYNRNFFDIDLNTHREFMYRSIRYAYPEGYQNSRTIEIQDLESQLKETQRLIDSVEREHFFFKNSNFLMDKSNLGSSTSIIDSGENIYYMQSAKKRKINDPKIYSGLKTRARKTLGPIDDKDFIVFVDTSTLNSIPEGPEIKQIEDIYITSFEINIYPRTLETYDPTFEVIENPVDDYLNARD